MPQAVYLYGIDGDILSAAALTDTLTVHSIVLYSKYALEISAPVNALCSNHERTRTTRYEVASRCALVSTTGVSKLARDSCRDKTPQTFREATW